MSLPLPTLQARDCAGLSFLTDESLFDATGVRMGFTRRFGGVSEPPYDSLNLGSHVEDDLNAVVENRARLLQAAGLAGTRLVVPNQIHGAEVLSLSPEGQADELAARAAQGADGLAVSATGVTALLCFADCVPVGLSQWRIRRGPCRMARGLGGHSRECGRGPECPGRGGGARPNFPI